MKNRIAWIAALAVAAFAQSSSGATPYGTPLLVEDFKDGFSQAWTTSASKIPYIFLEDPSIGSPNMRFTSLNGSSVLSLTSPLDTYGRYGLSTVKTFGTRIRAEARVNSLDHSSGTNIEQFIELWLVNSVDISRYAHIALHNGNCGASRYVTVASNVIPGTPHALNIDANWQDNQWYKLRIEDDPLYGVMLSVWNDLGTQQIASYQLGIPLSSLGASFNVGISQFRLGRCGPSADPRAAVDYVSVMKVR